MILMFSGFFPPAPPTIVLRIRMSSLQEADWANGSSMKTVFIDFLL